MKTQSKVIIPRKMPKHQKKKQLERSRRDAKVKKLYLLCVSKGFREYVRQQGWEDDIADAAAWLMHHYFMHINRINERGWLPIDPPFIVTTKQNA